MTNPITIPLWPDGPADAKGRAQADSPFLQVILPGRRPSGPTAAMLVCPGGGYAMLAGHEGLDYALWLNTLGIAGAVLNYRLGSSGYRHPAMLNDALRGMRLVRSRSSEWNIDPARIGVMGSSAGGHLASTLLTHFDGGDASSADPVERADSRPDLGILCYPVITMGDQTHSGSRDQLLGPDPPDGLVDLLSNERRITDRTPPCFLWHAADDDCVRPSNSLMFASGLAEAGVPFELHVYEKGGHGMGLGKPLEGTDGFHPWTSACRSWLAKRGFLAPSGVRGEG
jgi:acetyl esterase/lipase